MCKAFFAQAPFEFWASQTDHDWLDRSFVGETSSGPNSLEVRIAHNDITPATVVDRALYASAPAVVVGVEFRRPVMQETICQVECFGKVRYVPGGVRDWLGPALSCSAVGDESVARIEKHWCRHRENALAILRAFSSSFVWRP
jgi:hypothetical protein